jgi:E3 ubiquitin-protein ligase HUWE1
VGQAQLSNHPSIIPAIISIFTSGRHLKVLIDKENAVIIGTAVDELIRHHPSLKHPVFEALKSTLNHLENIGMAYTASDDIKRWYQLLPLSQVRIPGADITMEDPTSSSQEGDEPNVAAAEDPSQSDDEEESEEKTHVNDIVNYIDVLGRVSFFLCLKTLGLIYFVSFLTVFSNILSIAETSYSTRTVLRGSEG